MNKQKFMKLKAEIIEVMGKGFVCDNGGDRLGSISEFYGGEEDYHGFWCTGEDGHEFKDSGMQGVNNYAFDIPSIRADYSKTGTVLNEFYDWLDERHMYLEWYDGGTIMIYVNDY